MFYLSSWLEARRAEYYERLRVLGRKKSSWTEWCEFFLRGIDEQAEHNAKTASAILSLYEAQKKRVLELTRSQYAVPLLDELYKRPMFQSAQLDLGPKPPSKPMIAILLRTLTDSGILRVVRESAGRRAAVYALADLINLCEGKRVI
jgi:hypothetical protein